MACFSGGCEKRVGISERAFLDQPLRNSGHLHI